MTVTGRGCHKAAGLVISPGLTVTFRRGLPVFPAFMQGKT